MKKAPDLNIAKQTVNGLLGQRVILKINRGRNRVKSFKGVLNEAHSNVFVVELADNEMFDRISCTYIDMLCGEVMVASDSQSSGARQQI